ncbi:MAG: CHASE domain-containing protein, partial [Granulosicoccus sp.]
MTNINLSQASDPHGDFDASELKQQQVDLRRKGRLHWAHWCILSLSVIITMIAWQISSTALQAQESLRFDRESQHLIDLMSDRIRKYEDALLAGVATLQSHNGHMSRRQWRLYSDYLHLTERYTGINGIGIIHYVPKDSLPEFIDSVRQQEPGFRVHPEHAFDLSMPITYIEPQAQNSAAVGLDVAFEQNRRNAALQARSSGKTQISGPITLVQDSKRTPGFLFYAPYYQGVDPLDQKTGKEQFENGFRGFVYAPLIVQNLVEGVLGEEYRNVSLTISDGDTELYSERSANTDEELKFTRTEEIYMHGRVWSFYLTGADSTKSSFGLNLPDVVLVSGLVLEAMLFTLFWMMSRSNSSVMTMAEEMTEKLADRTVSLAQKNEDLEAFARVVSHDLKTPIRNICSLTEILGQDFVSHMASNDDKAQVERYLDMLGEQAVKSQTLITGVLDYSLISQDEELESVDTAQLIWHIASQLSMDEHRLSLAGKFPVLQT